MAKKRIKKRKKYKIKGKLGTGARFKRLKKSLTRKKVRNPDALAVWIGRKKYGKKKFQQLAAKGRRKKTKKRK